MKSIINRIFCKHNWSERYINDFEIPVGRDAYAKCIGESAACPKCGKRKFAWIKSPK